MVTTDILEYKIGNTTKEFLILFPNFRPENLEQIVKDFLNGKSMIIEAIDIIGERTKKLKLNELIERITESTDAKEISDLLKDLGDFVRDVISVKPQNEYEVALENSFKDVTKEIIDGIYTEENLTSNDYVGCKILKHTLIKHETNEYRHYMSCLYGVIRYSKLNEIAEVLAEKNSAKDVRTHLRNFIKLFKADTKKDINDLETRLRSFKPWTADELEEYYNFIFGMEDKFKRLLTIEKAYLKIKDELEKALKSDDIFVGEFVKNMAYVLSNDFKELSDFSLTTLAILEDMAELSEYSLRKD